MPNLMNTSGGEISMQENFGIIKPYVTYARGKSHAFKIYDKLINFNYKLVMDLKCFPLSLLGYTLIKNTKHMIICKIGGWIKPNVVPII